MPGRMVEFPANGSTSSGYLATPESGRGQGVIVIQEWWGLNDHVKDVADTLAREGFVALAPDLYHGKLASSADEAGQMMGAMDADGAVKDLRGAVDYLTTQSSVAGTRVGVVGFCMGGFVAMLTASLRPDKVGAVSNFYGVPPNSGFAQAMDLSRVKAPVLGSFGADDAWSPEASIKKLQEDLRKQNVETDFKIYQGAGHGFYNPNPASHRPEAARDAWDRTLRWFRQHLG